MCSKMSLSKTSVIQATGVLLLAASPFPIRVVPLNNWIPTWEFPSLLSLPTLKSAIIKILLVDAAGVIAVANPEIALPKELALTLSVIVDETSFLITCKIFPPTPLANLAAVIASSAILAVVTVLSLGTPKSRTLPSKIIKSITSFVARFEAKVIVAPEIVKELPGFCNIPF